MTFPPNLRFALVASEPESFKGRAPCWDVEHRQLMPGRYQSKAIVFHTTHLQLGYYRYFIGVCFVGGNNPPMHSFGFPLRRERLIFCGKPLGENEAMATLPGQEFEIFAPDQYAICSLSVDSRWMEQESRQRTGHSFADLVQNRRLVFRKQHCQQLGRWIYRHLCRLHGGQADLTPLEERMLENEMMDRLFEAIRSPGGEFRVSGRLQAARRARQYIMTHLHRNLAIEDLCRYANCSRRTLHQGFKDYYGISPRQFSRIMRLNEARKELLRASYRGRVSAIAIKWGFEHFGRFSREYRKFFGELPRATGLSIPFQDTL